MSTRFSHALVIGPKNIDGSINVIIPGYCHNKLGYWICVQSRTKDGGYLYSDQIEFFVKEDETTFQRVVDQFKLLFPEE